MILPDDSVVVRTPTHIVHFDAPARTIHVREPSSASSRLGGMIRASFPFDSANRIREMASPSGKRHLCLDLSSGETLNLGEMPSLEVAITTARAIADLTRCRVDVAAPGIEHARGMAEVIEALMDSDDSIQSISTSRKGAIDDGVDGLAATVADGRIDELIDDTDGGWASSEDSAELTQPERVSAEFFDEFVEETELDPAALLQDREPVFQKLLNESQLAAAVSPVAGDSPTDLHVAARPNQTPHEAVMELLRATVESLPEATSSMAEE